MFIKAQQPIPPDTVYKFYGVNTDDADDVIQSQRLKQNTEAFYGVHAGGSGAKGPTTQSEDDALRAFYGVEEPRNQADRLG